MGEPQDRELICPRCDRALEFAGTKSFHEGTRFWDFMGGVFELFKGREALDLYVCPRCGRVEFFVAGVGEDLRGGTRAESNILMEPPPPPHPAGPEWNCRRCGSLVPGNFEVCWECGAAREPPGAPPPA